ncbi:hypothetical protein JCM5350_006439 [Sporobolomyces pararoseus]
MPYLYEQPSPSCLIPLLRQHLPHSLPTFSTLQTPGKPLKVYSTFPATAKVSEKEAHVAEPWIVLIDAGNQFRFYCSELSPQETRTSRGSTKRNDVEGDREIQETEAEKLLEKVIEEVMLRASKEKREIVRIGAVPDRWTRAVENVTGIECISASRIWCDPSWYISGAASSTPAAETAVAAAEEDLSIPEGFEFRDAREEDIPVILSTSEVPHLPSYLSTRLSHTSCLFSLRSPSPSSSSSPSSPSSAVLVGHVTTHRDGSLGTLYVNPSYRRLGLARLVLRHRLSKMRQETEEKVGYCYVHRENEASRAVMESIGWRESEGNVSWDIVNVEEWENRRELRN